MEQAVYMNRELSWLKFNERVLEEAEREDVPLCERLSFVSIFQSNLDEFFMVRVGSLIDQRSIDKDYRENKTHMTAQEQLDAILPRVRELNRRKDEVYQHLMDQLAQEGVRLVDFRKITPEESAHLERYFDSEIAPLLSPVIVDKRQPFPFMKNKEIFAAAVLQKKNGKSHLGLIYGSFQLLAEESPQVFAYRRTLAETGENYLIACNFSGKDAAFTIPADFAGARRLIGNYPDTAPTGAVTLRPYEAFVLQK